MCLILERERKKNKAGRKDSRELVVHACVFL